MFYVAKKLKNIIEIVIEHEPLSMKYSLIKPHIVHLKVFETKSLLLSLFRFSHLIPIKAMKTHNNHKI